MPVSLDDFVFPTPWRDLRSDDEETSKQRRQMSEAFRASFGAHNSGLRTAEAIAIHEPTGEVLARADDGSFILGTVGWDPREDHYRHFPYARDWEAAVRLVEERAAN